MKPTLTATPQGLVYGIQCVHHFMFLLTNLLTANPEGLVYGV